jgi:glycine/D-amino acid oxidase-like deaminating enzyme/nitrite reductase/ring-hydroxylating ferredoxin subunit
MKEELSHSLWAMDVAMPTLPVLEHDAQADVCIVGAGIAGLTTAYLLSKEGKSVIVLDAREAGGGQTSRTTAHLSNAIDDGYYQIEQLHGERAAQLAAASHTAAIHRIERIVRDERMDCSFQRLDGYLFSPPGESSDVLERELDAARRAGLRDTEWVDRAPWRDFDTGPCLRFPAQAQFHPLRYLEALARAILRQGGRLFSGTRVKDVRGGTPARAESESGVVVTAGAVVVATGTPINDRLVIHTKQAAYRSYVIAAHVPPGSLAKALYWDTADPYHYLRLADVEGAAEPTELLIVGGEDHKTGQEGDPQDRYHRLEAWARERFPSLGAVVLRWSGQCMEPVDGVAFIGRNPWDDDNVYVATGDSGMGMTHGTIAGILLSDLIRGRTNAWADLYDPARKTLTALATFAEENMNAAFQYADWFTGSEVDSRGEIPCGAGAVLRRGLSKVAVYRDDDGALHEFSAVCPHLGAIVRWNAAEKTWDCPAHGSRFGCCGQVLQGPANGDLSPLLQDGSDGAAWSPRRREHEVAR